MKIASFILFGLAILMIILDLIFAGPTYGVSGYGVLHNSLPITVSILIFLGVALFLVDYTMRRRRRKHKEIHHDAKADRDL